MSVRMGIRLRLGNKEYVELQKRFAEAQRDYPTLTMDSFVAWALRYYLQHAYQEREDEDERGNEDDSGRVQTF